MESLRNETIVQSRSGLEAFPVRPRGVHGAIERALVNEDMAFAGPGPRSRVLLD